MTVGRNAEITVRAPKRTPDKVILSFLHANADKITAAAEKARTRLNAVDEFTNGKSESQLKAEAAAILSEKVRHYSSLMGLYPAAVRINGARSRLGSCSSKGVIHFSFFLMRYPDSAIDYVVVHELAHLKYMDHGKEFYALIDKYLPDRKERQKLLKN